AFPRPRLPHRTPWQTRPPAAQLPPGGRDVGGGAQARWSNFLIGIPFASTNAARSGVAVRVPARGPEELPWNASTNHRLGPLHPNRRPSPGERWGARASRFRSSAWAVITWATSNR